MDYIESNTQWSRRVGTCRACGEPILALDAKHTPVQSLCPHCSGVIE